MGKKQVKDYTRFIINSYRLGIISRKELLHKLIMIKEYFKKGTITIY